MTLLGGKVHVLWDVLFYAIKYVIYPTLPQEQDDAGESDNVIFIAPILPAHLTRTTLWGTFERALAHLTGRRGWYPYDVSNNLNKAWDHTRIHPDCFGREEYTVLLYLNEEYSSGDLVRDIYIIQLLGSFFEVQRCLSNSIVSVRCYFVSNMHCIHAVIEHNT